jgi:hypothetical protein
MADIGLLGSSLTLYIFQLGNYIIRLKFFWDTIKDIPEKIKYLIKDIEILSLILSGFETSKNPGSDPGYKAILRYFQIYKKIVEILNRVVKEFEAEIIKRKRIRSIKAVLKRNAIKKLRERLIIV